MLQINQKEKHEIPKPIMQIKYKLIFPLQIKPSNEINFKDLSECI